MREKVVMFLIVVFILAITSLHYATIGESHALHDIYREFYYVPVLLGALFLGLKGSLLVFLSIFLLYLPYVYMSWTGSAIQEINRFLHLVLQGLFAVIAGTLIDRDRRHRYRMEKDRYLAGIGRVAAAIVHDLKNPLTTILGFGRRLQEGKGRIETALPAILDSASRMEKIVNDVLDFAKPMRLNLRAEDMGGILRRACAVCRERAEERGVVLEVNLPDQQLPMAVDGFNVERAVVNLVTNAVEASDHGQRVSIDCSQRSHSLVVRIRDEGAGMDDEILQNLFTPFQSTKKAGTGLGMSIAKKIVDSHGGTIRVDSRPGSGTELTLEFPTAGRKAAGENTSALRKEVDV